MPRGKIQLKNFSEDFGFPPGVNTDIRNKRIKYEKGAKAQGA